MKSSLSDIDGERDRLVLFGTDILGSVDLIDVSNSCDGDEIGCNITNERNYDDDNENTDQPMTFHDAASHYSTCASSMNNSIYEDARTREEDCSTTSESEDNEPVWIPSVNRPQNGNDDKEENRGELPLPQQRTQNLKISSNLLQPSSPSANGRFEDQSHSNIGIAEKAFGEVVDFWVWGKSNIFVLGNLMGTVEQLTEHVVQNVVGTTLHEVESTVIRPHLQHVDSKIVSPTIDVVTKIIHDASHQLMHGIVEPFLAQLLSQRGLLLENPTLYGEKKLIMPSVSLASRLRIDSVNQRVDYQGSWGSLTENSDCTDDSPLEGVTHAHIYVPAENDEDEESAFFIGYHDYDDDLSVCWVPLNAPPPSPVNLYESNFSTLTHAPLARVSY